MKFVTGSLSTQSQWMWHQKRQSDFQGEVDPTCDGNATDFVDPACSYGVPFPLLLANVP